MAFAATESSMCMCTFGAMPAVLSVSSQQTVQVCGFNQATTLDNKFPSFGMCSNPSNPAVASATTAAMGVLTPVPCTPVIAAPWQPGATTVLVCGKPLLNNTSKLMCSYPGGIIEVVMSPGLLVSTP